MSNSPLLSDDTVIVFAQALTGLGHLRVTHALYHGLPQEANPIMLSSQDEQVNYIHKLASINPFVRSLMEFSQNGWAEDVFTWFARAYFRQHTKILEEQFLTILSARIIKPKTVIVVATHTLLAHQFAAIKDSFAKKNNVRVVFVVIVTDDSPQHIWAVSGADIIVVPSENTKRKLSQYQGAHYVVLPYMVSPRLSTELSIRQFSRRKDMTKVHIAIPISGAAVQLSYYQKLIAQLSAISDRYFFHIVSHRSGSTSRFLSGMMGAPRVSLWVSASHRETVELYEALYEKEVIALEVTKPSEQSFKALLSPRKRGGAILLFSDPIGRQEWDNLRFMIRHHLIPTKEEQERLWRGDTTLSEKAHSWRGLRLPVHSKSSAQFIHWCLTQGVFASMVQFSGYEKNPELAPNGVAQFWKLMEGYLQP